MRPLFLLVPILVLAACSPSRAGDPAARTLAAPSGNVTIVAAEDVWGSLAAQVGGDHAQVTSLIANPAGDPHDYEPTPADARRVASARYVIINGAGYDAWAQKLLDANPVPGRRVLSVADVLGQKAGANPHFWYSPDDVARVIDQISSDLKELDPAAAASFEQQRLALTNDGFQTYHALLTSIQQRYQGTPVGATESLFVYMAGALGLNLVTPSGFMQAIAQGVEPSAADKAAFDRQIASKQIKVLIYNKQDATPDTEALKQAARAAGIPIVPITETLTPPTSTFQAWQVVQLQALAAALAQATGQ